MQELLDAYFLKARGASDSLRDRDACKVLAGLISDLLQQLRGGSSGLPSQTVATANEAVGMLWVQLTSGEQRGVNPQRLHQKQTLQRPLREHGSRRGREPLSRWLHQKQRQLRERRPV